MKTVYILTETDSTDSTWCYSEAFAKKEDAIKRLHSLYKENVIDNYDSVASASFSEDNANAEMKDGNIIAWNLQEREIL